MAPTKPLTKKKVAKKSMLAAGVWHPIETAPNDVSILVAYDDMHVEMKTAEENTYHWVPYKGPLRAIVCPTHWMPVPEAPR